MKSFTDLEQSKRLAEILPPESADMWWNYYSVTTDFGTPQIIHLDTPWVGSFNWYNEPDNIPCWSLAALLDVLPKKYYPVKDHETNLILGKPKDKWYVLYWDATGMQDGEQTLEDNSIDACYKMILKLHEQKLL